MKKEIADFIEKVIYYILGLTVLFFIILKCYLSTINDNDYVKDTISNTLAFLSAISTIGAAVIASRLFSDWKSEKSYDIESHYLSNIISKLKVINIELANKRSIIYNIMKTRNHIIFNEHYLTRKNINLYDSMQSIYYDIQIYSKLSDDNYLKDKYRNTIDQLYTIDTFYKKLLTEFYRPYLNKTRIYLESNPKTHTILVNYSYNSSEEGFVLDGNKESTEYLNYEINSISIFFKMAELCTNSFNINHKDEYSKNFINMALQSNEELLDYCIHNITPK